MMFGGNFDVRNFASCDGRLLAISSHSALFSLLGTIYGGDGRTTFALPDLRGRFPMNYGSGPGLSQRRIGEKGGQESVSGAVARDQQGSSSRSHNTMPPFLAINFQIALQGVFPSRS
ncbi:MAG: tail fiber protein [Thermoanaerobaculia bacterium]|nr:tail fiber protein [Thermoanaerobaculia bacterium]